MRARRTSSRQAQPHAQPFVPVCEIPAAPYLPEEEAFDGIGDDWVPDELSVIDPDILEIFAEAASLGGNAGHILPVFPEGSDYELYDSEIYLG